MTSESVKDVQEPVAAEADANISNSGDDASPGSSEEERSAAELEAEEAETPVPAAVATPEEELVRVREQLMRTAADFDNYRKRSRRDVADAERRVQEQLIRSLLPTFDNMERAATHAESASDVASLVEGLGMVMRQFQDTLSGLGIERVNSVGQTFDPAEHEAVQHVETSDVPPGAVAQELQPGYRWNGRLVRPAMVVVAKAPAGPAKDDE